MRACVPIVRTLRLFTFLTTCQLHVVSYCVTGELREDSGYLTDKNTLPVTQLRFGDTGSSNEYVQEQMAGMCRNG